MMALAGYPLGLDFLFLDREAGTPAHQVAPSLFGSFTDPKLLDVLADRCNVITFDWENVPAEALEHLESRARIAPPRLALATAQDRLLEKALFAKLRIPTNRTQAVDSHADLQRAVREIGLPGVLKTRRLGYDGKGQQVLRKAADIEAPGSTWAMRRCSTKSMVPFDYEVSAIGVRGQNGEFAMYPLNRNLHQDGILRLTRAPWKSATLEARGPTHPAQGHEALRLRRRADHRVLRLRGRLLANEMAPRVHNSGHWTIEGAVTSQFENHLRAICGLPLGSTAARGHSAHAEPDRHHARAGRSAGDSRAAPARLWQDPATGTQARPPDHCGIHRKGSGSPGGNPAAADRIP